MFLTMPRPLVMAWLKGFLKHAVYLVGSAGNDVGRLTVSRRLFVLRASPL